MTLFPFIWLGIGILIGISKIVEKHKKITDFIMNISLVILMIVIGCNIGSDKAVISSIMTIGLNCFIIAFLAIMGSVVFIVLLEKTFLPLDSFRAEMTAQDITTSEDSSQSSLIWIIPLSIILGIGIGYFFFTNSNTTILDIMLKVSLAILYGSVGIMLTENSNVIIYIKKIGFKVILISISILIGSFIGGYIGSVILNLPFYLTISPASGMSYYSITGAYLTEAFGIEAGTYGFLVNVFREFLTVLFLPILIKISKGSPIAAGAAGNMDTMLVPITKFVGKEIGMVALITGTILTLAVPFILPLLTLILK